MQHVLTHHRRALKVLHLEIGGVRLLPELSSMTVYLLMAVVLLWRPEGIFVSEFEQGEIGPDLFRQACKFGLEGLVSKRRDRPQPRGPLA